jgi:hypothetical protein
MKMKKNLTLISLMLGVMLLASVSAAAVGVCGNGIVEAGEQCDGSQLGGATCASVMGTGYTGTLSCSESCTLVTSSCVAPTCNLVIDEPKEDGFYDPVTVTWHLEGNACHPIDYTVQYNTNCDLITGWKNITSHIDALTDPMSINWNNLPVSGQYCLRVNMYGAGCPPGVCCSITKYTGIFNLDLTPPIVNLTVGDNNAGDCTEGTGTCYVNTHTPVTLTCSDNNPVADWQSGSYEIQYQINDGPVQTSYGNVKTFQFNEDSNHQVKYWCYDAVGKESAHKIKNFAVDTVAPIITKTVGNPKISGCDETWEDCDWYVNTDTKICISAVDQEPHPSNNVQISCEYTWWNSDPTESELVGQNVQIKLDENGCFSYGEDSWHELHCTATDALGNSADLYEADIVDAKAPITTLSYTGPYYSEKTDNGLVQWIDGVSRVVLSGIDQELHPVNNVQTYYRYGIVDDSYCYGTAKESTSLEGEFALYTAPFGMDESCHLIEYYSVDALGNTESIKQEFVFVDKTAPLPVKEVGNPSHNCAGLWEGVANQCEEDWNWIVTMNTSVKLSCEEQGPHPSGVKELCYKITWDGGDVPKQTEGVTTEDGYTCINSDEATLYFTEECKHTLDFYCVDNVEKTSEHDIEIFKVEGKSFEIPLDKKWNLISVPVNLLSSDVAEVFADNSDNIEGVWGYENGEWKFYVPGSVSSNLEEILPGHGYWVKASDDTSILIGGSLPSPQTTPPSVELDKGWNLIGHYGLASKPAYCSLFSLVDTQQGFPRWSALWGYNSGTQSFVGLNPYDNTDAGKGYWVEMDVADTYSPSTVCWGFH